MRAVRRGHDAVHRVKMKSTTLTWPAIDPSVNGAPRWSTSWKVGTRP